MTRAPRARARVSAEPAAAPTQALSLHRRDAELEAWICRRLKLRDLFAGSTDTATRAQRLKAVLLERDLVEAIAGRIEDKPITWRALLAKLYHVEL